MSELLVISPHYDDAVFSCGALLANKDAAIITAYSGAPAEGLCTEYDRGCGFATSAEAIAAREQEDRRACSVLDVGRLPGLGWLDAQYALPLNVAAGVARMRELLSGFPTVLAPLGIVHPDHVAVADAVLTAWWQLHHAGRAPELWLYEELPYRVLHPEFAAERIAGLRKGLNAERMPGMPSSNPRKLAAASCYDSQLPTHTAMLACLFVPERLWAVGR